MTRPIVVLCVHGEAKPHRWMEKRMTEKPKSIGYFTMDCPGGRVLEQAIIIERDTDGEWPEDVIQTMQDGFDHGLATTRPLVGGPPLGRIFATHALDALASAQEKT